MYFHYSQRPRVPAPTNPPLGENSQEGTDGWVGLMRGEFQVQLRVIEAPHTINDAVVEAVRVSGTYPGLYRAILLDDDNLISLASFGGLNNYFVHHSVGGGDEDAIDDWNSSSHGGTLFIQYDYADQLQNLADVLVYVGIPHEGISYVMWGGVLCTREQINLRLVMIMNADSYGHNVGQVEAMLRNEGREGVE